MGFLNIHAHCKYLKMRSDFFVFDSISYQRLAMIQLSPLVLLHLPVMPVKKYGEFVDRLARFPCRFIV